MGPDNSESPMIEWVAGGGTPESAAEEMTVAESRLGRFWERHRRGGRLAAAAALLGVGVGVGLEIDHDSYRRQLQALQLQLHTDYRQRHDTFYAGVDYGRAIERADELTSSIGSTILPGRGSMPDVTVWRGVVERRRHDRWVPIIKDPITLGSLHRNNSILAEPYASPHQPAYIGEFRFLGPSGIPLVQAVAFDTRDRFIPDDPQARSKVGTYRVFLKNFDASNTDSRLPDLGLVAVRRDGSVAVDQKGEITPGRRIG